MLPKITCHISSAVTTLAELLQNMQMALELGTIEGELITHLIQTHGLNILHEYCIDLFFILVALKKRFYFLKNVTASRKLYEIRASFWISIADHSLNVF